MPLPVRTSGTRLGRPAAILDLFRPRSWTSTSSVDTAHARPGRTTASAAGAASRSGLNCAHCGHANSTEVNFCTAAVNRCADHAAAVQEDRRQVSVLFVDIVDFTTLRGAGRPGAGPQSAAGLLRHGAPDRAPVRRGGREVHRRRGDGAVRRAGGHRQRRVAVRPRRPGAATEPGPPARRAAAAAGLPGRHRDRRGPGRPLRHPRRWAGLRDRRRGQHGLPPAGVRPDRAGSSSTRAPGRPPDTRWSTPTSHRSPCAAGPR